MLQLNLLPDVKKEFLHAQRERNLVMSIAILSSVIAGGVVVVLGLIMGGQMVQKNIITGNIDNDKKTLQGYQTSKQLNEYLTVQNQLSQIDSLKTSQPIFSRLFDYLQQLNPVDPNSVALNTVTVTAGTDSSGSITIELQGTTATFASLNVYKTTLTSTMITYSKGAHSNSVTEHLFSSVSVSSASLSQNASDEVAFTIDVTCNPAAFSFTSTGITLKVPQETTSDAIVNAPSNVFNDQSTSGANTNNTNNTDNTGGGQ